MSKKNEGLAERLLTRKPTYTFDMLIPERYPMFIDALRDLDHCLTMVYLFLHYLLSRGKVFSQSESITVEDLYALTRYVDAQDRPSGTNDEESEHSLPQLQDQLPSNELGALMNLVANTAFMSEDDEETRENSINESGCEMTITIRDDGDWHAMLRDYFFDVEPYKSFHIISRSSGNEMYGFGKAIDNDPDGIMFV
nr:pescadillo homolog [Tanacetum cinerariifolium]